MHPKSVNTTIVIDLKLSESISPWNVDELDRNKGQSAKSADRVDVLASVRYGVAACSLTL